MRLVKYLWAAALSMGVVLFFCSLTSFVRVRIHADEGFAFNLLWGADYMLITLTMTRLAVRGKKKIFLLITLMLAMYLLWRACAERADVSRVIMSIIAALSLIIAALTIKERAGCIIFFPVLIWHGFLLAKLFGAL